MVPQRQNSIAALDDDVLAVTAVDGYPLLTHTARKPIGHGACTAFCLPSVCHNLSKLAIAFGQVGLCSGTLYVAVVAPLSNEIHAVNVLAPSIYTVPTAKLSLCEKGLIFECPAKDQQAHYDLFVTA